MSISDRCPIWGTPARRQFNGTLYAIESSRAGGAYQIDMDAIDRVPSLSDKAKARLTTMLVDQRRQGIPVPKITRETIDYASSTAPLPVYQRAERLLKYLTERIPIGTFVDISYSDEGLLIASESFQPQQVLSFIEYLESNKWITCRHFIGGGIADGAAQCEITVDGYGRIEELRQQVDSAQAFVAMWLDDEMNDAYQVGIVGAITNAGYRDYRVDKEIVQSSDAGKIDDTIVAEIRRSRFVIADFTHGRGGIVQCVFRSWLCLRSRDSVIYSCRKDKIKKLHFDTRQYYHIPWETPEELRDGLEKRILAMVGKGH